MKDRFSFPSPIREINAGEIQIEVIVEDKPGD